VDEPGGVWHAKVRQDVLRQPGPRPASVRRAREDGGT
jgi:hypothetical protein